MNLVTKLNPDTLAPPPGDMHAHIAVAEAGSRLAFIAGQVSIDRDAQIVAPGDVGGQAEQCFRNIQLTLEAMSAAPSQVVEMTIIVVDYQDAQLDLINAAGVKVFGGEWPATATTLIGAQALGHSAFLVEVKATVALPPK